MNDTENLEKELKWFLDTCVSKEGKELPGDDIKTCFYGGAWAVIRLLKKGVRVEIIISELRAFASKEFTRKMDN